VHLPEPAERPSRIPSDGEVAAESLFRDAPDPAGIAVSIPS
jgi:hypothetical protein